MEEKSFDLVLLSGPENIFYLIGQQTPGYYTFQSLCIPAQGEPFHVLRGLEAMNARLNTHLADIIGYADDEHPAAALAAVLKQRGWHGKRVGIDQSGWFLTVNLYNRLIEEFGRCSTPAGLWSRSAGSSRRLKSSRWRKPGMQMTKVCARALPQRWRAQARTTSPRPSWRPRSRRVASMLGMEPFVTSGPRSGIPHTTWRRRRIEPGDLAVLESAACYNRYHAALFRTVAIGAVPQLALDMYKVCAEALEVAIEKLRPGNSCADVHNAVQTVIDRNGYTAGYRKRTGYSMGISFAPDWGEGNILSLFRGVDVALEPGMVFHVPITLREYNRFTVAVSETVMVTERAARPFSAISRELVRA